MKAVLRPFSTLSVAVSSSLPSVVQMLMRTGPASWASKMSVPSAIEGLGVRMGCVILTVSLTFSMAVATALGSTSRKMSVPLSVTGVMSVCVRLVTVTVSTVEPSPSGEKVMSIGFTPPNTLIGKSIAAKATRKVYFALIISYILRVES